ncbi:Putative sialic acid transporter [bacterium HR40]|nr:Putative sialic acid transporter [bacterium HR40]
MPREWRLTLAFCTMQVLGLSGTLAFQALIPQFRDLWQLTATEAGWIASASYVSYALAAPLLVALTDRLDARAIVVASCLLSAAAGFGFALFADGLRSALWWRTVAGIGIAGTFMPGLKALSDRLRGPHTGRLQSFYTASFSLGSALSLFLCGVTASLFGWRAAFLATGVSALVAALLLFFGVAPEPPPAGRSRRFLPDPRPVLADRRAMAYIFAYAAHTFELFTFRTWVVALLTFAATASGNAMTAAAIASLATSFVLLGLPASILGNELATRWGRRRALVLIMTASAAAGLFTAVCVSGPPALFLPLLALYACLVMADSAAITVGTLEVTPAERRGTAIAVQTLLGSLAAMAGPLAAGMTLDRFATEPASGWFAVFALTGLGVLAGPLALHYLAREPSSSEASA